MIPSARERWSPMQRALFTGTFLGFALLAALDSGVFFNTISLVLLILYSAVIGVKVFAVLAGLARKHTVFLPDAILPRPDDPDLPVYTILVPLYREAGGVADLVKTLSRLEYPPGKLDVKLLLEADDDETAAAAAALDKPAWLDIVTVPAGVPRTKPRACNDGLARARGEFLVIFDAEDRPEPDQLRKAVAAFRRLPAHVACLQAKLNFYNSRENLLTRCFTLEYSAWFDLYLPGLHALGAPVPLGGTSNHFRTEVLRTAGGWDAWNVAEDCDLGMRLARSGARTRILDSTTWEEAPSRLSPWIRQRSRWVKGYWQTFLVHTRQPRAALREFGTWAFLQMLLSVGGLVFTLLANPVTWGLFIASLLLDKPTFSPDHPWTLLLFAATAGLVLFNGVFVLIHALGAFRRGFGGLAGIAPVMPGYWILMSVGAWRGFFQFFGATFFWEKTPHGAAARRAAPLRPAGPDHDIRYRATPILPRAVILLAVATGTIGVVAAAALLPRWLNLPEKIRIAAIAMGGRGIEAEKSLEESWFGRTSLDILLKVDGLPDEKIPVLRSIVHLKVLDGEWYQTFAASVRREGNRLHFDVPLDTGWTPKPAGRPWGPWCLRRVRGCGIRLFDEGGALRKAEIIAVRPSGEPPPAFFRVARIDAPAEVARRAVFEARFSIDREFTNPFDPDVVDITGVFTAPSGMVSRVPGFYAQDYYRWREGKTERLRPQDAPYWAVRFAPAEEGEYRLRLEGKVSGGERLESPGQSFRVIPSNSRGYVRVDPDGRHFTFENGDFFYPVMLNIRSARDGDPVHVRYWDFPLPEETEGTFLMDEFLTRLGKAGITAGRTWFTSWWGGLEWRRDENGYHGLGVYNLQNAWRVDRFLESAARSGVYLEFVLNSHGPFIVEYDSQWKDNPFNRANGGPLRMPSEVLTSPEAKRLFRNRYRYIAARYGANLNIFGWTLWSEVNYVNRDPSTMRAWHQEMTKELRRFDPGRHSISTEFHHTTGFPEVYSLPEIDYTQLWAYNVGPGLLTTFRERARSLSSYRKPAILEEYGGIAGRMDMLAQEIHDGLWAGWMMPFSASPMSWWWNLIFAKNLERFHRRFSDFAAGEDLRGAVWSFPTLPVTNAPGLSALARVGPDRAYAWIHPPRLVNLEYHSDDWLANAAILSNTWKRRVGNRFDPLKDPPGPRFPEVKGAALAIPKLNPGVYDIEFWSTWDTAAPGKAEAETVDDILIIPLPAMEQDVAIKVKLRKP
ncbi:MAG: glycosyltransferase family 2 protein [Planctomycetota bacterium]